MPKKKSKAPSRRTPQTEVEDLQRTLSASTVPEIKQVKKRLMQFLKDDLVAIHEILRPSEKAATPPTKKKIVDGIVQILKDNAEIPSSSSSNVNLSGKETKESSVLSPGSKRKESAERKTNGTSKETPSSARRPRRSKRLASGGSRDGRAVKEEKGANFVDPYAFEGVKIEEKQQQQQQQQRERGRRVTRVTNIRKKKKNNDNNTNNNS
mmetsp:Transcript_26182/g.43848  ORF Transcript_26182/g.43848 Transcript_26182/m.43848 type:complete len:209 (-) Transcript_26182:17-643(-)